MEFIVDQEDRLDRFLVRFLPDHSRTKLSALITAGEVLVDDKKEKPSFIVEVGMKVTVLSEPQAEIQNLEPADMYLDIVYEDEFMMVINKPRGLAVHPAVTLHEPSLVNVLLSKNVQLSSAAGAFRPGIVHRLDKDTTGVILVAKNDTVHANLAKQIEDKTAERRYFAVVAGDLSQERFTIQAPIGRDEKYRVRMAVTQKGKPAVTHIKQIARVDAGTLIAARLETGRTHQIRVHLRATGHPVVGDKLYAPKEFQCLPMQLHAAFISFEHPVTNEKVSFYATPPTDFVGHALLERSTIDPF